MELAIFLAVAVVVALYTIGVYNGLVKLREAVKQAWANIDVLLVQRHDELPKLVETCKQYMQYEQETLERIMKARASVFQAAGSGDVAALGAAETSLRSGLGQLFAVAENYPQLKADESFQHLQARITALEEGIADRRELYNSSVNLNNVRVQQFPDLLVAKAFSFGTAQLLEFADEQKRDVNVKALFG
ncbi:MAG: LemA family protein [Steroidobacteraceae bacterium]|jgi:LemA protein